VRVNIASTNWLQIYIKGQLQRGSNENDDASDQKV
jgi:hypothetical protein